MFARNSSSDSILRPRRVKRRGSVVDWLNGLTDNNEKDPWARVDGSASRVTRNGSVTSVEEGEPDETTQHKQLLINDLKKEVKNIMAESASKKRLDINSAYVTSLCGSIESCLMDGLRRRLLGLLGCRSSLALLHSAARDFAPAEMILLKTMDINSRLTCAHPLTWIREAIMARTLPDIILHISSSKQLGRLYEPTALMMDRAKSGMVYALSLGPCAISFKRMSGVDCVVDDALNRSGENNQPTTSNGHPQRQSRPPLTIQRQTSSIASMGAERGSVSRDFVYSLHHNFKSSLLYGKNNVCVANSDDTPVKGYLSLHKSSEGSLALKWTPNQLMHASSQPSSASGKEGEQQWLWRQAINLDMADIIYIHLHQREENSAATVTLVDCEGVQSAPLQLPAGQHAAALMSSLEAGLAPQYRLDPPLWVGQGKEKMLPRLRKRSTAVSLSPMMDLVFRIVRSSVAVATLERQQSIEEETDLPECVSLPNSPYTKDVDNLVNFQIDRACKSVKHQIMARAFFGWLSHCRHLRTIRKHLMYLVNARDIEGEDWATPVDEAFWKRCRTERTTGLEEEFLIRVYWKGIEGCNSKELRRQAWPYLIGLFEWSEEPEPKTSEFTVKYREDVEEWRILEAEVRRRDEEAFIAARQRKLTPPKRDSSIMSDVFEDEADKYENGVNGTVVQLEEPIVNENEELLKQFTVNLHRIDKDVERCDRNLLFFSNKENLESLRRAMCTYVRRNLEEGYIQGMCDILAPLLVIFEDEALTLECFTLIMNRLRDNFPQRSGMDQCLTNFRSLIQIVDGQIFQMLTATSDFSHLYFSYRWFLLDFKRELSYDCTYKVWETIWAAGRTFTPHFPLFFGLSMVTNYRDVIINNNMDFADMIKFFNEMAERHDCVRLLQVARNHVKGLQAIVQQMH